MRDCFAEMYRGKRIQAEKDDDKNTIRGNLPCVGDFVLDGPC